MKYILVFIALLTNHLGVSQDDYLIDNVKLFDGYKVHQRVDIVIVNGKVHRISKKIRPESEMKVVDGRGKTIIPGLINSHVHAWVPYHLKNALEAGVFAVLDMHTYADLDELRSFKLEDGYARFYSTGFAATVDGGHGTQYGFPVPTIGEDRNPEQFVKESYARGSDYIKIIYEPSRSTLSRDQVIGLVKASKKYDYKTVAHISRKEDAIALSETGIRGFAHLWKDGPIDQNGLDLIVGNGLFIIPTLSVIQGVLEYYESEGIDHTLSSLEVSMAEVKRLSEAGVMILAGTDPPNVGLEYGSSIHNELELFVNAGLSPIQALKTATSNVAQTFGIDGLGVIKQNLEANFILIDGDPTRNISDSKKIHSMWAGGKKIK